MSFASSPPWTTLRVALVGILLAFAFSAPANAQEQPAAGLPAAAVPGMPTVAAAASLRYALDAIDRFPRADLTGRPVDGIVILGGAEDSRVAAGRGTHALNEAAERLTEAAALARRYPNAKIAFTGGAIEIIGQPTIGADAAAIILTDLGVDSERVLLERRARNTWENAVNTQALVEAKPGERWLLVTSAWHMPRAIGIFRKAGFAVEPWPTDYRTAGVGDAWMPFANPLEGLRRLDLAVKEWVGLFVNWVGGRSDALLPAP